VKSELFVTRCDTTSKTIWPKTNDPRPIVFKPPYV
jgi:hypothetical protein